MNCDLDQSHKKSQTSSFVNLKTSLIRHIDGVRHKKIVKDQLAHERKHKAVKENINLSMRQLAYFCLKSNLPYVQFDKLLATVNFCDHELGKINHSDRFIKEFSTLVDMELIKKTAEWFRQQENDTVTLDIGTIYGIPLLAVLFISSGTSKLADIMPLTVS